MCPCSAWRALPRRSSRSRSPGGSSTPSAAIGSMLAFNFFFVEPLYTSASTKNWFALLVFLVTRSVASWRRRGGAPRSRGRARCAAEADRRARAAGGEALEAEALRRSDALKTALLRAVSPRPALAADGHPHLARARSRHGELTLDAEDRLELAETILGRGGPARPRRRATCSTSRDCRPAPPSRTRELWPVDDLVVQALDGVGRRRAASRSSLPEDVAGRPGRRRTRSERVLANLSRTRSATRRPDRVRVQVDAAPLRGAACASSTRAGHPPGERGPHLRAVPPRLAPRARGAGLGLAIARGFAEANGGRVWAESHAGRARRSSWRFRSRRRRHRGAGVTGARVLVVDDEPQILRALRTSLRGAGYEVDTAETAEAALALRRCGRPKPSSSTSCCRTAVARTSRASCAVEQRADDRPLGRRRRAREGRRPRRGRRRLRDEAGRDRRAARAPARGAAPDTLRRRARDRAGRPAWSICEKRAVRSAASRST